MAEDPTLVRRGVRQLKSADRTGGRRTDSTARGFLAEAKMRAVLVIVRRVRGEKPLEMGARSGR